MQQLTLRTKEFCRSPLGQAVLLLAAATVCLLWAYWPTLATMAERWSSDAQYSHGFLVPVFAATILWFRRERFPAGKLEPNWGAGLLWLMVGLGMHLLGGRLAVEPLDAFSLLPTLVGLCLLLGGRAALRWAWPAIAFLGFMLPLPYQVELFLAHPLRRMATSATTYVLQLLGFPALAEGNVILIDDLRLGVIDACSGLGMLVTFFALSTAFALVIERPLVDRLVLVVSAIPIALIANILRITATAIAHRTLGSAAGNALTHDLAGWLMMPLALGLLWLEMTYLRWLVVEVEAPRPLPLGLNGISRPSSPLSRQGDKPPREPRPLPAGAAGPEACEHST